MIRGNATNSARCRRPSFYSSFLADRETLKHRRIHHQHRSHSHPTFDDWYMREARLAYRPVPSDVSVSPRDSPLHARR